MEESKELTEALETIDDIVDRIGKLIMGIAQSNEDFICTECLCTAGELYQIIREHACEDDANQIAEEFKEITGRNIDEEVL